MTRQKLVQAIAEALAATALRLNEREAPGSGGWKNRYYTLSTESRFIHYSRAEIIVDRLEEEGLCVDAANRAVLSGQGAERS